MNLNIFKILFLLFFSASVYAAPEFTNFQAYITKPNGQPLESNSVTFTFKYKNLADNCTVFVETYSGIDMTGSGGAINLQLGSGAPSFPVSSVTLYDIFSNQPSNTMACLEGGTYAPLSSNEGRLFIVEFSYPGSNGTQTIAGTTINSVPYAMYASQSTNSEQLGGVSATDYIRKSTDVTTCTGGQFSYWNGTSFVCGAPSVSGFSGSLSGDITGTQTTTYVSSLQNVPLNLASPSSGEVIMYNGSQWISSAVTSGTVTEVSSDNTYITVTNPNSTPTLSVNVGTGAGSLAAGDDSRITGAWQASSSLSGDVTGTLSNTVVSEVGGKTSTEVAQSVTDTQAATSSNDPSTIVKRDSSGNINLTGISATNYIGRNFYLYDNTGTDRILLKAPNALSSGDYSFTLPVDGGSSGYVLATDGSGNTSWIPASTGSVTSVTASSPLMATGTTSVDISLAQANATTDGYLSSSDWSIFNSKQDTLVAADSTHDGYLTSADWSIFNNKQDALVASDATHDGYLTSADWSIFNNKQDVLVAADGTHDGYLTSTDWTAFNSKQNTLNAANATTDGYLTSSDWSIFNNKQDTLVAADGTHDGYLTSADWTTFNNKLSTITSTDVQNALSLGNGFVRSNSGVLSASALTSTDVTDALGYTPSAGSGLTSLNGQLGTVQSFAVGSAGSDFAINSSGDIHTFDIPTASAGARGLLSSSDWSSFSAKQDAMVAANATTDGYLTSSDWSIFNNKQDVLVAADATHNGYLTSTDWTAFNSKQNTLNAANATTDGYLTSSDWSIFNSKQDALVAADATHNGYLTSTDWTTFNNKLSTITSTDVQNALSLGNGFVRSSSGVLSASALTSTDVTDALGYTPSAGSGLTSLNGQLGTVQTFSIGSAGSDFAISSSGDVHTFDLPTASAGARGLLSSSDWSSFSGKVSSQWSTNVSGDIYYNSGKVGIGSASPLSTLYIESTSSTETPLIVKSAVGNSVDIFSVQDSAGNAALKVKSDSTVTNDGNFAFEKTNGRTALGTSVIPADAANVIQNGWSAAAMTLKIKGATSQSEDMTQWQDSSGNVLAKITNTGHFGIGGIAVPQYALDVSGDVNVTGSFKVNGIDIATGGGTVTSVTASAPLMATGTTSVDISLAKADGSTSGYLSSSDWTMFNNKQNALSAANATTDGYLTSTDWTAFNNKLSSIDSADVTTALGYTPVNRAGDTMTGALNLPSGGLVVGTSQLAVTTSGNVGIGTNAPTTEFMVVGAHGSGSTLSTGGAGTRMFFYPRKSAFRAGNVTGTQWDEASVGNYSVAMGASTTASGDYSTALGYSTIAGGNYSFSTGGLTAATGVGSTAMGTFSMAKGSSSTALGQMSTASGDVSLATGSSTSAEGTMSTAMGFSSRAVGSVSTALGAYTTASGDYSTAMGMNTTADSYLQTTIGRFNMPKGSEDLASWVSSDPLLVVGNGTGAGASRANALMILKNGQTGIGVTSPTATLHLKAGTTAAGTAPLKLSTGVNMTAPEDGAMEFDGTTLFFTSGGVRRVIPGTTTSNDFSNVGSIYGSGALTIGAGGTNQNLTLQGSGTGSVTTPSQFTVTNSTDSTSPTTGAVVIAGGVGVGGSMNVSGDTSSLKMLLRNGNMASDFTNDQILFGYGGSDGYKHAIKTRHNSGGAVGNAIDFYVWKQGTDAVGDVGTQHVMSLDGGSVGIGITTPGEKLHVSTSTYNEGIRLSGIQTSGDTSNVALRTNLSSVAYNSITQAGDSGLFYGGTTIDNTTKGFVIAPWSAAVSGLRMDAAGNVGLGIAAPTAQLHLNNTQSSLKITPSNLTGYSGNVVDINASSMDNLGTDPTLLSLSTTVGGTPRGYLMKATDGIQTFSLRTGGGPFQKSFAEITHGGAYAAPTTPFTVYPGVDAPMFAIGVNSNTWPDGAVPVIGASTNIQISGWAGGSPGQRNIMGSQVVISADNSSAKSVGYYADVSGANNNYAFYAKEGLSYLKGNVGVGTTPTSAALTVSGDIVTTPSNNSSISTWRFYFSDLDYAPPTTGTPGITRDSSQRITFFGGYDAVYIQENKPLRVGWGNDIYGNGSYQMVLAAGLFNASPATVIKNKGDGAKVLAFTNSSDVEVAHIKTDGGAEFNGQVGIGRSPATAKLEVAGAIASITNPIATGRTVDLALSNTHTLDDLGGTDITLTNMVDGGQYTIVITDAASRTYTFTGCTNSFFKPANAATTVSTRSIYGILTIHNGSDWDCYINWQTGYTP